MNRVLALSAMTVAAMTALAVPARAFDDRPSTFAPIMNFLGAGQETEKGDIDFRERAPLVIPKSAELPPPRPGVGPRVANWPQDQDVVRRRDDAARARVPQQININANPALDKTALLNGRTNDAPVAVNLCDTYVNGVQDCAPTAMDKIRRVFTIGDANRDTVVVGKEPDRDYLTQPPRGYRRATETVKATRDGGYEREDVSNPAAYFRQQEKRNSEYR